MIKPYSEMKDQYPVFKTIQDYIDAAKIRAQDSRHHSWEYCHKVFSEYLCDPTKYEVLSLHLAGFLASWGMYRGSSFLLREHSYMIHRNFIPELREHADLMDLDVSQALADDFLKRIDSAYQTIQKYYRSRNGNNDISLTLVSKILLCVYGCFPAFDRYFKKGLAEFSLQKEGKAKNVTASLLYFLKENNDFCSALVKEQEKLNQERSLVRYPFMKLVDMYFYEVGRKLEKKEAKNELSTEYINY